MAGRQLQAQQQARARAAADIMDTSMAGLDRHPPVVEKGFWENLYGEPTTRSGIGGEWTVMDIPERLPPQDDIYGLPPTSAGEQLSRNAYLNDLRADPRIVGGSYPSSAPALDELSFVRDSPLGMNTLPPVQDIEPGVNVGVGDYQWPPFSSQTPVGPDVVSGSQFIPERWRTSRFITESGNPLVSTGETYPLSDTTLKALGGVEPDYGNQALLREDTAAAYAELKRRFADEFKGKQLKLASAFRNRDHNAALPGSDPESPHMEGDAIDISFQGLTKNEIKWLKHAGKVVGLEFKEYDGSHHFDFNRLLADEAGAADIGMIEAVDKAEEEFSGYDIPAMVRELGERVITGPSTAPEAPLADVVGELPLGQEDYLGSQRQIDNTAYWQGMLEDKKMREAMEGYGPRTPAPVATAIGATDYPYQTGHNVVGYGPGGLGDLPPADVTAALMRDSAAPVLPVEEEEVVSDLIPDFYDDRFHVPTAVQNLQAKVGKGTAPLYRDERAGLPNELETVPLPNAEVVASINARYQQEADDALAAELEAQENEESLKVAKALRNEQLLGSFEERASFYFPEEFDPDPAKLAEEIGGIQGVELTDRIRDLLGTTKDKVAEIAGITRDQEMSAENQAAIDQLLGTEGQNLDATGEVVGVEDRVLPPYPQVLAPEEAAINAFPTEADVVTDFITDIPPATTTAQDGPLPLEKPISAGPEELKPPVIEEAETIEDWTAALYGEPPGVPQFPVVPQPGTPELTKMGFFAKNYRQSDLVNPPSEMVRNAFPWAANLPTDILERAARNPDFLRELMDKYGRPEGGGSWTNPDLAATAQVAQPSPQVAGQDNGVPPDLQKEIDSLATTGGDVPLPRGFNVPYEAAQEMTSAQDAQVQSDARASLNELIGQLSWIQKMAIQGYGIDLDKFSGFFTQNDIAELYQFMLQNKDKVGPEIWAQIEAINEALG
tara:strand:- start:108 stop:2960 length:2853 start_codon:yes stop_codon:yes gene_type:complete